MQVVNLFELLALAFDQQRNTTHISYVCSLKVV